MLLTLAIVTADLFKRQCCIARYTVTKYNLRKTIGEALRGWAFLPTSPPYVSHSELSLLHEMIAPLATIAPTGGRTKAKTDGNMESGVALSY